MKKGSSPTKSPGKRSQIPVRRKKEEVPKSEISEFKVMTFAVSTLFNAGFEEVTITPSKSFTEIDPKEYNTVFAQKVKECQKICDFSIGVKDVVAKKTKSDLLKDIMTAFDSPEIMHLLTPSSYEKYFKMVTKNICRPMPQIKIVSPLDVDDQVQDTAWPHLFLVYKTLNTLMESNNVPTCNNKNLVQALVSNCCGPDDRERFACKDILRKMYSKCPNLQQSILRAVVSQFQTKQCSADLLEFFGKVVAGYQASLTAEQISTYKNAVLFLHSSPNFLKFCLNLLQVINQHIKLDPSLYEPTIEYIISHWPSSSIRKQILMLSEVEGLFLGFPKLLNERSSKLVFTLLSELITQPNIDLSETSCNVIIGPALEEALLAFTPLAHKILDEQLLSVARNHWNDFVRDDSKLALQMMSDIDNDLLEETLNNSKDTKKRKKANNLIWKTNWAKVFETAKSRDNNIQGPNLELFL